MASRCARRDPRGARASRGTGGGVSVAVECGPGCLIAGEKDRQNDDETDGRVGVVRLDRYVAEDSAVGRGIIGRSGDAIYLERFIAPRQLLDI